MIATTQDVFKTVFCLFLTWGYATQEFYLGGYLQHLIPSFFLREFDFKMTLSEIYLLFSIFLFLYILGFVYKSNFDPLRPSKPGQTDGLTLERRLGRQKWIHRTCKLSL